MNLIGKILVGVIFVMSIVFMTLGVVVYSTQHQWKDQCKKLNDEKSQISTQNTKLQSDLNALKDERDRLATELQENIVKLEGRNKGLEADTNALNAQVVTLSQENHSLAILLQSTQDNMATQYKELVATRDELAKAKTELHIQFEAMLAEAHTARIFATNLANLTTTFNALKKDLADASYLLAQLGYDHLAPAVYDIAMRDVPPRVDGTITDIRPDGLLEINIGRDDGLLQGHKLHVYREKQGVPSYLGRIEVIDVKPGKAVGKIMPEYRSGTILRNDFVTAYVSQVTASL